MDNDIASLLCYAILIEETVAAMEGRQDSVGIELYTIEIRRDHFKEDGHHGTIVGNGTTDNLTLDVEVVGIMVGELAVALTDIVFVAARYAVHGGNQIEQGIATLGAEMVHHIQVLVDSFDVVFAVVVVVPHAVDEERV
jgi:hypothetical protein